MKLGSFTQYVPNPVIAQGKGRLSRICCRISTGLNQHTHAEAAQTHPEPLHPPMQSEPGPVTPILCTTSERTTSKLIWCRAQHSKYSSGNTNS